MEAAARAVLVGFVTAIGIVVSFKLLRGTINTSGLLTDERTGSFSPGRLQLLFFTATGAISYSLLIGRVDCADLGGLSDAPCRLPGVPLELLSLVGVSNAGYLGGKIYSYAFSRSVERFLR